MHTSENTTHINKALFAVQGEMRAIKRNAENPHFSSRYVTWDDLAEAVIPYLQKHGILMEMEEGGVEGYKSVSLRLTHVESGEYKHYAPYRIKEASTGNLDHNAGKSTTYAMKRVLTLALGLRGTDEDNDGNEEDSSTKKTTVNIAKRNQDWKMVHKSFMVWCKKHITDDLRLRAIKKLTCKDSSTQLSIEELKMVRKKLEQAIFKRVSTG